MKTGLVLEGGGMRGLYTAGVLDAFMEHDITCGNLNPPILRSIAAVNKYLGL